MGNQVREETICARFDVDQCTGVFGGDMPIFRLSFFFIYAYFSSNSPWRILMHHTSKYAKSRKAQTFGG